MISISSYHRMKLPRVMARFFSRNRGLQLRPVNRIKHVIDVQGALPNNSNVLNNLIAASDTPDLAAVSEVQTGATVNGIYLKIEVVRTQATSGVLTNVYLAIYKNPGGNLATISPNTVGTNDNKRYVIHQEMVMLEQQGNSNPRIVFNGVIAIPRGYKRFGPNDLLIAVLLSPGGTMNYCLQSHYKEFR